MKSVASLSISHASGAPQASARARLECGRLDIRKNCYPDEDGAQAIVVEQRLLLWHADGSIVFVLDAEAVSDMARLLAEAASEIEKRVADFTKASQ